MNTRSLAAQTLQRITSGGKSLNDALDETLPAIPRDSDKAFVQALCYGVCRWYFRLDFILRQLAAKPIRDEHVRLLALIGLHQLEAMRVKPHAAVAETVSAAGRKAWAKPLLNGVLRTYQRESERLAALADAEESAAQSFPAWLTAMIRRDWPEALPRILEQSNRQAAMTLRVNLRQITREDYLDRLEKAGIRAHRCEFAPSGVTLAEPTEVARLPGFETGQVSVQDEAAQLAAGLLQLKRGLRVLDACAAPGGKTLHILEAQPDLGEVVALDVSSERLAKVSENLKRGRLTAKVTVGDAASPARWWDGKFFDRILLDAPCSAVGVVRRHPDIKLLRRPEDIAKLAEAQERILENLWPLLAEDGILIYATCSILKAENEDRIAKFLSMHPEAKELPIDANWGTPCLHGRQILSGDDGMDGFFYACLAK